MNNGIYETGDHVTWANGKTGNMLVVDAGHNWVHVQHVEEGVHPANRKQEVVKPEQIKVWSDRNGTVIRTPQTKQIGRNGASSCTSWQ